MILNIYQSVLLGLCRQNLLPSFVHSHIQVRAQHEIPQQIRKMVIFKSYYLTCNECM